MANIVQTCGGPGEAPPEATPQPDVAESCITQFNALNEDIKEELHCSYHSVKESTFKQFAKLLRFETDELPFLKIFIETKYAKSGCLLCSDTANKQNYDKIDHYFNETLQNILHHHRQKIITEYKHKSKHKVMRIQFEDISDALEHLLTHCYHINEDEASMCANVAVAPRMRITQGNAFDDDLKAMILDEDEETADAYEILINNHDVVSYNHDNDNNNNNNNSFDIQYDFKPFTEYSFQVRKHTNGNKWSEYCEAVHVTTEFKCIWSQIHHGNNVHFAGNNKYICCKSDTGDCTVLCDDKYVITSTMFKEIAFVFKIEQLAQDSYFGFIDFPLGRDQVENLDALIHTNKYSFCLGGHHGSGDMDRFIDGKPHGTKNRWTGVWSSRFRLQNKMKINHGDRFIFVINFEEMYCDVFVNEIRNELKISPSGAHTFGNIPHQILPFYSHEHTQYGAAHSKVSISLYNKNGYKYQLR